MQKRITESHQIATRLCENCGLAIEAESGTGRPPKYCSDACRMQAYRARADEMHLRAHGRAVGASVTKLSTQDEAEFRNKPYDASSIQIIEDFSAPLWDWKRAQDWASHYSTPVDWLKRAIQACREADVDPNYVRRRYLEGRKDVALNLDVDAAHRRILREDRA